MIHEIVMEWQSAPSGPLNPAITTWTVNDQGDITNVSKTATRLYLAMTVLAAARGQVGQFSLGQARSRPLPGGFLGSLTLDAPTWEADIIELEPAWKTGVPITLPAVGTTHGVLSYSGRGDAIYVAKLPVTPVVSGPRKGGWYVPFPRGGVVDSGTGLIAPATKTDILALLRGMFLGAITPAFNSAIPQYGLPVVVRETPFASNAIGDFAVRDLPSRLRSRTR